LTHKIRRVDV